MDKMKTLMYTIITVIILISSNAYSATVTVGWDPNEDADYYVVYMKKSGETEDKFVVAADNVTTTEAVITLPDVDQMNDYSVKAFNTCGNSSDFSDIISHNAYVNSTPQKVRELRMGF